MSNIRSLNDDAFKSNEDDNNAIKSFVGGEKSGLAVENPTNNNALPSSAALFRGSIPFGSPLPGSHKITLYKNGFCVDDGEFRPLTDPINAKFVEDIRAGFAPQELQGGASEPISLAVEDQQSINFEPPAPPTYTLFSGEGRCAGGSAQTCSQVVVDRNRVTLSIDASQPTTTVLLRLCNGQSLRQQFNQNNTIADLHKFVVECSGIVEYELLSGFPPRPISKDNSLTLKDAGRLITIHFIISKLSQD